MELGAHRRTALGSAQPKDQGHRALANNSYLPVVRCIARRVWPGFPRPGPPPPLAGPRTGGGGRRVQRSRAGAWGVFWVPLVKCLGMKSSNTGPRAGSTTATTIFDLLG